MSLIEKISPAFLSMVIKTVNCNPDINPEELLSEIVSSGCELCVTSPPKAGMENRWITFQAYDAYLVNQKLNPEAVRICSYKPAKAIKGVPDGSVCGSPALITEETDPLLFRCKQCKGKIGCITKSYTTKVVKPKAKKAEKAESINHSILETMDPVFKDSTGKIITPINFLPTANKLDAIKIKTVPDYLFLKKYPGFVVAENNDKIICVGKIRTNEPISPQTDLSPFWMADMVELSESEQETLCKFSIEYRFAADEVQNAVNELQSYNAAHPNNTSEEQTTSEQTPAEQTTEEQTTEEQTPEEY